MTPAPLLCALALLADPSTTEAPTRAAVWLNGGGVLLTAAGNGDTIDIPFGFTLPIANGPNLEFEATYFRWTCTGNVSCTVNAEQGGFVTAGFHFDAGGEGLLRGFFLEPKVQLSTLSRTIISAPGFDGQTFGAELGLDLGYQWRLGPFYLALVVGGSGGVATHYPSGPYGLLVEWNGGTNTNLAPKTMAYVFGINANVVRVGFTL